MRIMDVHSGLKGIDCDALVGAFKANAEIQDSEGAKFLTAWADPESGKVFCVSEAPNKEAIKRIHERTGHPVDEVYELPLETGSLA